MMFGGIGKESFAVVLLVAELKDLKVSELIVKTRESKVPLGIVTELMNIARLEVGLEIKRYRSYVRVLEDNEILDRVTSLKVVLALLYAEYKFYKELNKESVINVMGALEKYLFRVKDVKCCLSKYKEYIEGIII